MFALLKSQGDNKKDYRQLDVVPEITRIHDEDPVFCSLLLSTKSVDAEEELTNGLSAFCLENNVKDRPKADYESALSSPVGFILIVVGNTPQTLSTLSDSIVKET